MKIYIAGHQGMAGSAIVHHLMDTISEFQVVILSSLIKELS